MSKTISFFHAVNSGDMISNLPGIRAACRKYEQVLGEPHKAIIYQKINQRGHYMAGYDHPLKDEHGNLVTMNRSMLAMLKPLIEAQSYVEALLPANGEPIDFDLHRIHNGTFVNMPYGPIQMWPWFVFPDMRCNLVEPWIAVPPGGNINVSGVNNKFPRVLSECLIVNFTERYRNDAIEYHFLRKYADRIVFAGTQDEYKIFCDKWKLNIPYLQINDFLELAQAIGGAKGFIGNQSMCWNIAEAMKTPRACEYFARAPNCFPFDREGTKIPSCLYLYQADAELWVAELMNADKSSLVCPVCDTINKSSFNKKGTEYYKCVSCGTLYSDYLEQANMLGGLHEGETSVRSEQNLGRIERIKAMGCTTLLDFGCGNGELVQAGVNSGMQVFGYDKYSKDYNVLPSGEVDFVSMIEVIEHTYYPYDELTVVHDALKPGGFLYVETSFADFLTSADDYVDPAKGHCTIWSYRGMDLQMARHGFVLVNVINRNTRVYKKEGGV